VVEERPGGSHEQTRALEAVAVAGVHHRVADLPEHRGAAALGAHAHGPGGVLAHDLPGGLVHAHVHAPSGGVLQGGPLLVLDRARLEALVRHGTEDLVPSLHDPGLVAGLVLADQVFVGHLAGPE
jgi:hypothetical protein